MATQVLKDAFFRFKRLPLKAAAIVLAGFVASGAFAVYFVPQLFGLQGGVAERGPLAGLTRSENCASAPRPSRETGARWKNATTRTSPRLSMTIARDWRSSVRTNSARKSSSAEAPS